MNSKVTLSFDETVIEKAKKYAADNNISLSRLIEYLLNKTTSAEYKSLEDLPVSDWVNMLAEGKAEYKTKAKKKDLKTEYYESRK